MAVSRLHHRAHLLQADHASVLSTSLVALDVNDRLAWTLRPMSAEGYDSAPTSITAIDVLPWLDSRAEAYQ